MKLKALLNGIILKEFDADMELDIKGISFDSRSTSEGDLFVAIKGYESDGHQFMNAAVEKGAVCVLCEEKPADGVPYVLIENTRRDLSVASANWFGNPALDLKIIGVTGTNGKTTTSNLMKSIIEKCSGAKVGLIGTNHNMIGDEILPTERTTPESYQIQELFRKMADAGCAYAVMEVSSHALYLDRVYGVMFEVGVFTNLTPDHLDFHRTMEEYGKAKALLFRQSRYGVINLDDKYAPIMLDAATCPVYTYSVNQDSADLVAKRVKLFADKVEFCALTIGSLQKVELGIPGLISVYNALSSITAAVALGFDMEKITDALRTCVGVKGRAEVVPTGRDFTVIIDYAHTPDALENIIKTFREVTAGRLVTLFGCGGDRDATKRPVMGDIAARLSDFVIVTSDNPRTEVPGNIINDILAGMQGTKTPYIVIENRREAIGWAIQNALPGDIVILAGKGHETYQIFGKEKVHFDEREVVAEFLSGKNN